MRSIILGLCIAAFSVCGVFADLTIVKEEQGDEVVAYFKNGKAAEYENSQIKDIVDLKANTFTVFNHNRKVYAQTKFSSLPAEYDKFFAQQSAIYQGSPEMQKFIEQQKKMVEGVKLETKEGDQKSVAGYPCTQYIVYRDGNKVFEKWVSLDLEKLIGKSFDYSKVKKQADDFYNMLQKHQPIKDPEMEADHKIEQLGFVVFSSEASMFSGDPDDVELELVSVETGAVDDGVFNIPADYTKVEFEQILQLEQEDEEEMN